MTTAESIIVSTIRAHADREGSGYSNWYCGIASDPDRRLFDDHNVPRGVNQAWWTKENAGSELSAREIEEYLLGLGFNGGNSGGDSSTTHVYAYRKISGVTRE